MGGGGAMKAAAKVAGITVVNGGLRGVPSVSPVEHQVASATHRASRPVSSIVASTEEVNRSVLTAAQNNPIDAASQRPCWELDDWEFADGVAETIVNSGEPMPRLVFGGVPTLEEAKEATSELKEALDKWYICPHLILMVLDMSLICHCFRTPNTRRLKLALPVRPQHCRCQKNALKAFRLLNENPVAQSVVVSIASDPNVWHAVLQNEALVDFLQSHKSSPVMEEYVADAKFMDNQSAKSVDDSSDSGQFADSGNGFMGFVQGIKTTVVEMMSSLSDYFQNLFGGPTPEKVSTEADGSARTSFVDGGVVGASLIGLAVMVMMVVVLKRG
ncbi:unnamed protein product [Camellia sinensis]